MRKLAPSRDQSPRENVFCSADKPAADVFGFDPEKDVFENIPLPGEDPAWKTASSAQSLFSRALESSAFHKTTKFSFLREADLARLVKSSPEEARSIVENETVATEEELKGACAFLKRFEVEDGSKNRLPPRLFETVLDFVFFSPSDSGKKRKAKFFAVENRYFPDAGYVRARTKRYGTAAMSMFCEIVFAAKHELRTIRNGKRTTAGNFAEYAALTASMVEAGLRSTPAPDADWLLATDAFFGGLFDEGRRRDIFKTLLENAPSTGAASYIFPALGFRMKEGCEIAAEIISGGPEHLSERVSSMVAPYLPAVVSTLMAFFGRGEREGGFVRFSTGSGNADSELLLSSPGFAPLTRALYEAIRSRKTKSKVVEFVLRSGFSNVRRMEFIGFMGGVAEFSKGVKLGCGMFNLATRALREVLSGDEGGAAEDIVAAAVELVAPWMGNRRSEFGNPRKRFEEALEEAVPVVAGRGCEVVDEPCL